MWMWLSIIVVLVGAELNSEIEHQTARDSTTGAPLPLGMRGAAMLGDEMIDEASRKMATKFVVRGERAGLSRSET